MCTGTRGSAGMLQRFSCNHVLVIHVIAKQHAVSEQKIQT